MTLLKRTWDSASPLPPSAGKQKRPHFPSIRGVLIPNIPVTLHRDYRTGQVSVDVPTDVFHQVAAMPQGKLILPLSDSPPAGPVISHFVAKTALEAMAHRLSNQPEGLDYLCDEAQLNLLRDHARRGTSSVWPVHTRRIYNPDSRAFEGGIEVGQTLHEFDFHVTNTSEWFFVLAIFGLELTINLGGPEIDGYVR